MITGYIKLFRQFLEWGWYKNIPAKILFLHILLKANHRAKKWQGIDIMPGQFITSIENLANETGLTPQQVRTAIKKLKSTSEITSKSTSRYSIITVQNWKRYQADNKLINKQITSKQHASNMQITTTKECKNEKNDKNINLSLLEEGDREILLSFARKRKADSPTAYIETLIANGSYLNILKDEKTRIERERQYEENRFYKPEHVREQTPEEVAECLLIIEKGRRKGA